MSDIAKLLKALAEYHKANKEIEDRVKTAEIEMDDRRKKQAAKSNHLD